LPELLTKRSWIEISGSLNVSVRCDEDAGYFHVFHFHMLIFSYYLIS